MHDLMKINSRLDYNENRKKKNLHTLRVQLNNSNIIQHNNEFREEEERMRKQKNRKRK